jgi:hypothetical protein
MRMERPSQAQAWLITLVAMLLVGANAQLTSATAKAELLKDPEEAWDVFSRANVLQSATSWSSPTSPSNSLGLEDRAKLVDNTRSTFVRLPLPAGAAGASVKWLTLNFDTNAFPTDTLGIQDLSMRFITTAPDTDPSSISFNYTACISRGEWLDSAGRSYFTLPNLPGPPDPRIGRIAWLLGELRGGGRGRGTHPAVAHLYAAQPGFWVATNKPIATTRVHSTSPVHVACQPDAHPATWC